MQQKSDKYLIITEKKSVSLSPLVYAPGKNLGHSMKKSKTHERFGKFDIF